MSLNWNTREHNNPFDPDDAAQAGCCFHYAESQAVDDAALKQDVEACLALSMSQLNANVKNESLFYMVEWQPETAVLRLSVTDGQKANDARDVVCCRFVAVGGQDLSDRMSFWAKDYLSTCTGFMDFSLVALFTDSTRARTQIL
ncbi:hypothetical protein [Marinobacterium weihaiense]|uniref:Uncharacterized protein n=1 Tax=Marinobacterium weihaiense TaxID=2851016 RepID=A0ABS6MEK5_9GAMM|nr:hypothetical protein [Marinobacterium weihaiense]MBV0934713.1 hypothetical protein [Marinobacterium weihaiense]